MHQYPMIPTLSLHGEIPLRPGRRALSEQDDNASQQADHAQCCHTPEEDRVESRGVQYACQESNDSKLGQAEGHDPWQEAHHGP